MSDTPRTPSTPFQALVVGTVMGALMKQESVLIDVEPVMEGESYTDSILVRGQESGEELLVVVMTEARFSHSKIAVGGVVLRAVEDDD